MKPDFLITVFFVLMVSQSFFAQDVVGFGEISRVEVGKQEPNCHGVYHMHGLIWEWVQDFNTVFISGESRGDHGKLKQFNCAAGSSAASETDNENMLRFFVMPSVEGWKQTFLWGT